MAVANTRFHHPHNMPSSPSKSDAQHQRPPPPPIPPSPTLTNPDMILPCDDGERENSTPSPPFNLPSLSNLQAFYGGAGQSHRAGDFGADTTSSGTDTPIGLAWSLGSNNRSSSSSSQQQQQQQKRNFVPRHTWTHEGHDASRRLSDIGEEDSMLSSSSPSHLSGFKMNLPTGSNSSLSLLSSTSSSSFKGNNNIRLAASPVLREREENNLINNHNGNNEAKDARTWSSSSSSTLSAASESSQWDGNQNQSQNQNSAQGQAQNQLQNGHVNVTGHSLHMGVNDVKLAENTRSDQTPRSSIVSVTGGPGEEFSSAILSSEAERILENAKKRLTLMEGNLTRARSSMRASPSLSSSPSPSGGSPSLGPHQPVGGLYRSISHTSRKPSSLRPRSTYQASSDNRHSRVHSETNLSSVAEAGNESKGMSRSLSAMASSSSLHNDDKSFRYDPSRAYLTHRASTSSFQPVRSYKKENTPPDTPKGLGISTEDDSSSKISNMDDFNSVYPAYDPPSRTQSQLQVRDLQDQMKGLHIKISSLKVKTQEDNLRRRSLQSLRTPSPLSAADQWYTNVMEFKTSQESLSSNSQERASRQARHKTTEQPQPEPQPVTNGEVPAVTVSNKDGQQPETTEQADFDDSQSVMESLYEDAEEGDYDSNEEIDREALNEILREPLDDDLQEDYYETFPPVPPIPNNEDRPHEEREDAFDYEHFILHSALGNFSQSRMRRASNLSNASVETTRPFHEQRSAKHSRTNSATSLSTIASFATATEGVRDDGIRSVLYWDRRFNDELRNHEHYHDSEEEITDQSPIEQGTPRAKRSSTITNANANNNNNNRPTSLTLALPQRSDSATTGSATPTSLASSLVSTVRAASASSPHPNTSPTTGGLNNDDERLLEQLFESLGAVCMDLQAITTSPDPDPKTVRVLRRRLDAARRVLDGELDT